MGEVTYRLGRTVNHDPRSLAFPAAVSTKPLRPVEWRLNAPVLDQGETSSCTGNAGAQALNSDPYWHAGTPFLTEKDAIHFYTEATRIDPFPGTYPAQDTGSNGLSVAKVLKREGRIRSYTHAFGLDHVRAALQLGPVMVGTMWKSDMFNPDARGTVTPTGDDAGGHEYLLVGDDQKGRLKFLNSWGNGWGKGGFFYMSYDNFSLLLKAQGDATVLVK